MILAEKIIKLRKQNGWSQEELAMRLNVSRQSVSKWESTASIPDLDRLIKMSELFDVTLDYLLKDDCEQEKPETHGEEFSEADQLLSARTVTLEEANSYMNLVCYASWKMAAAVAACILSPIPLILMGGLSEYGKIALSEDQAGGIGVAILLLVIAAAAAVMITLGIKLEKFEYLEKEMLNLQYGISGLVKSRRDTFEPIFIRSVAAGISLCILCAVPLMLAAAFDAPDYVYVYCIGFLLAMVAAGVLLFVHAGMIRESYQKLLEEGDYTIEKKLEAKRNNHISTVYWCVVTAVYLAVSLFTEQWDITWIIWPVAGVLYAAFLAMLSLRRQKY